MAAGGNHITPKSKKKMFINILLPSIKQFFFLLQNAEYRERRNTY